MVDAWLIVVVIILSILILGATIIMVIYFGHPDDKNEAYFPKFVVVFGLWLAFASILVLPYDVANSRGEGGGVRVDILWLIVYIIVAIMVFIIIPFAYFFYESDVDPADVQGFCDSQAGTALQYTAGFFVIFLFLLIIMYAFLNRANIPVVQLSMSLNFIVPMNKTLYLFHKTGGCTIENYCTKSNYLWSMPVTFPVFLICFMSFVGWFFWTFFVGVGLIALPVDLINDWRTRPQPMDLKSYLTQRERLGRRAQYLIDFGIRFQRQEEETRHHQNRSQKRKNAALLLRFERAFYFLKQDKELLDACKQLKDINPLWWILKLVLGIIGLIVSLTWLIHISIFVLPKKPLHPFLNLFFIDLENAGGRNGGFPLFGVIAFAIYAFYLLWCCIKGNFKLGIRLAFWKIYPMEVGKTKMNAFLANTWILLLCSVPTIQFSARSFPMYARETQIDVLFGSQIQYLNFFKYFWENNVFIIAMIVVAFITIVYLVYQPRDRAKEVEQELDAMAVASSSSAADRMDNV